MADGMTKGEIEDVLSSIRRLVSDGNRPVFRAAPRPFAREAEKLILTPALRVMPAEAAAPSRFVLTEETAEAARPPLGTVVTAIAAAVPRQVEGWESETGDPVGPFAAPQDVEAWIDDLADSRNEAADAGFLSPEDLPEATADLSPEPVADEIEDDDGWDIDGSATLLDFADPFARPQAEPAAAEPEEALPVVDSAMLSEMIRSVLREELRGPMGERITSSLRKLVRAEVARALTLRGQD